MKKKNVLKVLAILVVILLISLISFVGIYKNEKGEFKNILPDYEQGKEVKGSRLITFKVDTSTKEVEKETENNTEETAGEEATTEENEEEVSTENEQKETEEVPVNSSDVLTKENYEKSKKIIEKRLNDLEVSEYDIRVNDEDGTITLDMAEDTKTDDILQLLVQQGDFSIKDAETKEVLLGKDSLKEAKVMYYRGDDGITVYLNLDFKADAVKKLEEITKKYIETTDAEGNKIKKTISINIDEETLLTTYFGETISSGSIQLPIGSKTTDTEKLQESAQNSSYVATVLNNEVIPVVYTIENNQFVSAILDGQDIKVIIIAFGILIGIAIIYLLIKYDLNGILAGAALIGYVALTMLLIRFANVPIALGSISAVVLSALIQLVFIVRLLKVNNKKQNQTILSMALNVLPVLIIAIVCCFAKQLQIVSFGTAEFWGVITMFLYNYLITKNLIADEKKD